MPQQISVAVEGITDEAVAVKVICYAGGDPGQVFGKQGKQHLKKHIMGFAHAARLAPWLVLVDLDREQPCAPALRKEWLITPQPNMCFRVVVRAVESWLMADAERLAAFLKVPEKKIPAQPGVLHDPKAEMIRLARASGNRDIRCDMVPPENSGRPVGPAYSSRLIEFAKNHWRPGVAARRADSLARTICCIKRLIRGAP